MMPKNRSNIALIIGVLLLLAIGVQLSFEATRYKQWPEAATIAPPSLMENLGRGVVAMRTSSTQVYVGWRLLGTDPSGIAFNLYRATGGGTAVRLNSEPIMTSTNYVDSNADLSQA